MHGYLSKVRPTVFSNPSRKRSSNAGLRLIVDGKHFENRAFRKLTMISRYQNDFPGRTFLKHNSKMTAEWKEKISEVVKYALLYK